ncbi:MAG: DUF4416 family protein [Desulfamplus sp.]|nr:DUF4416 family protein [Desulfamplus sp.]
MSTIKPPDPAKLVISLLMNSRSVFDEVVPFLEAEFGTLDMVAPWFDFNYTDYYFREMGSPLFRRLITFKGLIAQDDLVRIKLAANILEKKWERGGRRSLNIDPGYLLLSRFILATGKDYSHRIYLGSGIYGDLTLIYKKGRFHTLEWTYPDYGSKDIQDILLKIREDYALELKFNKNGWTQN